MPLVKVTVHSVVAPCLKVAVPVGVPAPGEATVAEKAAWDSFP